MEQYIDSGFYKHMKELLIEKDVIQKNIYDHSVNHGTKVNRYERFYV